MAKDKTPIVERKKVVTIEYTLKDEQGTVLEDKSTLSYLHGFKNIPIGLEEALEGKKAGDTFSVAVP
ncbi:MAG: FKBP-type peptidyl-prolyl cis-trans isomerase, partial [Spirochaetia bacterium]|nr:FKBP-type peptidyl-prolyl cis-trans isomerase [Spirochaetia bacterium]